MLKKVWHPVKSCVRRLNNMRSDSCFIRNFPTTQCSRLSNGLIIATEERESSSVCMGVYVDSGSRYEKEENNGLTHLFEHIAFKSTNKREKSVLEKDISRTGAKFKCFTTRETAVYYVECLSQDLSCVADIFFDCVFNNAFSQSEIRMQTNVIYKEMLEHDTSTEKILYDYLHSTAFQGTPLAYTVLGSSKNLNIRNFNSVSLSNLVAKTFTPKRAVLVAVGGISHEFITALGEQYLGNIQCADQLCISLGTKRYTGSQIIYRNDSIPVAHVAIGVEGPSFTDKHRLSMDIASCVIGGWDASQPGGINHGTRLAHFASAGGLCESYKAFNFCYQDTGLWGVEFISPKIEVDDMIMTIQDEWLSLCHVITDAELIKAKNELKSNILTKLQTNVGAFHDIGHYVLRTGCRPSIYEQFQEIEKVNESTIRQMGDTYIYNKCPVVVGIGSTECLFPYGKTRSYMYWLRV